MKNIPKSLLLLCFFVSALNAQESTFTEKELILFAGPAWGKIKNYNIDKDQYASVKNSTGVNAGLNYCKYFNKNFGINFGLEFNQFKNTATYKGTYRSDKESVDEDGYIYYQTIVVDYKDVRTINLIDIPVNLRMQVPVSPTIQLFIDAGLKLNLVLSSKFKQNGTYETKGTYPNPNYDNVFLVIEDDAYYGFKESTYNVNQDLQANRANYSFCVGGGIKAKVSDKTFILINPSYMLGLNNIMSKNGSTEYENIFKEKSASDPFKLSQFVLKFGIGFNL
jgi:hypothetical protein